MIGINLVPPHLRKKSGKGLEVLASIDLPKEILLGAGSLFLLILILIHAVLLGLWTVKFVHQMAYRMVWQGMLPDKNNIDSISQQIKDLKSKMSIITDITSPKTTLWSQKLNIISDAIPKGVWLNKINWSNNTLIIEGSTVSRSNDEISLVGNFVSNLKKSDDFVKDFSSVELNSVNRAKKGMSEVADFIITAKVK